MAYHIGICPGMQQLGFTPCDPHITCDGCDAARFIRGLPPVWFLDGKAPPGWKLVRDGEARRDYCPRCKQ